MRRSRAASQEQASGIDQVNKAIMSMDETTQQNAALVEQTTSASQSMKEQAKGLMQQVAAFKIDQTGSRGTAALSGHPRVPRVESVRPSVQASRPKLPGKKPAEPRPGAATAVGVTSGTGKERGSHGDEFEEF